MKFLTAVLVSTLSSFALAASPKLVCGGFVGNGCDARNEHRATCPIANKEIRLLAGDVELARKDGVVFTARSNNLKTLSAEQVQVEVRIANDDRIQNIPLFAMRSEAVLTMNEFLTPDRRHTIMGMAPAANADTVLKYEIICEVRK